MSDLDRYKEVEHGVIISPEGEYVWFHDYEKLKAELNQRLHERTQSHLKSYRELKDQNIDLAKENQRLREALEKILKSATPHPTEHPAMHKAWQFGAVTLNEPLSETKQLGEPVSNADELDDHIVILKCLLNADDYDSIESVKYEAEDYLKSQNRVVPYSDVEPLVRAVGLDSAWPVFDVLESLASAVDHLFEVHNCDIDGWEQWSSNRERARELANDFRAALSTFTAKHGGAS